MPTKELVLQKGAICSFHIIEGLAKRVAVLQLFFNCLYLMEQDGSLCSMPIFFCVSVIEGYYGSNK